MTIFLSKRDVFESKAGKQRNLRTFAQVAASIEEDNFRLVEEIQRVVGFENEKEARLAGFSRKKWRSGSS